MPDPNDDASLRRELLKLDVLLRRKQSFWETPRALLLILTISAIVVGSISFWLGYKIASTPQQIDVHIVQEH